MYSPIVSEGDLVFFEGVLVVFRCCLEAFFIKLDNISLSKKGEINRRR